MFYSCELLTQIQTSMAAFALSGIETECQIVSPGVASSSTDERSAIHGKYRTYMSEYQVVWTHLIVSERGFRSNGIYRTNKSEIALMNGKNVVGLIFVRYYKTRLSNIILCIR